MADTQNKVRSEQVRLLYEAIPSSIFATIFIAVALVAVLWNAPLSHEHLITWLVAISAVSFARLILFFFYRKKPAALETASQLYERLFIAGTILAALAWSAIPLFLYPSAITYQVVIAFVAAGISAGAVTSLSFRLTTIYLFLLIFLVPLFIRLILSNNFTLVAMGLMVLMFLILLMVSAKRIYKNTEQNIILILNSDEREHELENNINALQTFHAITTNSQLNFEQKLNQLLVLGLNTFKLDIGIVSHITGDVYTVEHILGPEGVPNPGDTFDFNNTYCAHTFLGNTPKGFHHVAESEIASHPCYETFRLEAYLGAPVFVNNKRYGTLNFSSAAPRKKPFSVNEIALIQLFAQWVGSEMARTASELQLSQFKTTLDKTRDCVFMFDPSSLRFFYVNQGAIEQVGYSYKELLNMTPVDIKPQMNTEQFSKLIEPLISGEQSSVNFETIHQHKDGHTIPVDIFLQYIDFENEPPRFVAIVRDITERKRIENMKNEFVSTVSHELRTPLTSIRGSIGLITGGAVGELPEKAMDMLRIAYSNTERLLLLINDILDLQKIESGKMEFNFKYIDLQDLLEQAIEENEGFAREYKVDIKLLCKHKDIVIYADRERLMQVMSNLLSNAAKFSPPDATVDVNCHYERNHIRISVTDYGEGIPAEFHDNLFDKFTQADSSDSKKLGGTGLGLSIARRIIEQHHGDIGFSSEPGSGTTFYFDLPVSPGKT